VPQTSPAEIDDALDDFSSARLLALHPPRHERWALVFDLPDRRLEVRGRRRLILALLGRCNGLSRSEEIVAGFPRHRRRAVGETLSALHEHSVIIRVEDLPLRLAELTSNSNQLMRRSLSRESLRAIEALSRTHSTLDGANSSRPQGRASTTLSLLSERRSMSVVHPGSQAVVDLEFLADFVRIGYGSIGSGRRTVPSAGNLQPLHLYAIHRRSNSDDFEVAGYDDVRDRFEHLRSLPGDAIVRWFLPDPFVAEVLTAGGGIVAVCTDLRRVAEKYGPRGFRYALLEVGATMQNLYLLAAERSVGIRAFGGFFDRRVASDLDLPERSFASLLILIHPDGTES
jgi:SagB-type dehydrogenase family enzyme